MIENSDTFETISTLLTGHSRHVGYVAFGSGHAFEASVTRIAQFEDVTDIAYYGDLDDDGLTIPQRANAAATLAGLPQVRPAASLYQLLLHQNIHAPAPTRVEPLTAERRASWLPAALRRPAADILASGNRAGQEATGVIVLRRNDSWQSDL